MEPRRELWDFPENVQRKWNNNEIRILVLLSLFLQMLLTVLGSQRKRFNFKPLIFILWIAYLSADAVAIYALGILSNIQGKDSSDSYSKSHSSSPDSNGQLLAFWAPFLLLHLGGPDKITSFSLEDNALWLRHGLTLVIQLTLAIYIFIKSLPMDRLLVPTIFMFLSGISKYIERTFALYFASMDGLKNSLITEPDPGPDYAKLMEERSSKLRAGVPSEIVIVPEPEEENPNNRGEAVAQAWDVRQQQQNPNNREQEEITIDFLCQAHRFFEIFKRLIVDLILSFHERNDAQSYFTNLTCKQAFEMVTIELNFFYDLLYTKAAVVHTILGRLLRVLCTCFIAAAFAIFFLKNKNGFHHADIVITYVLLYGAMALDLSGLLLLVFSDWTIVALKKLKGPQRLVFKIHSMMSMRRWSNQMGQFNLLSDVLRDPPCKKIVQKLNLDDLARTYWYPEFKTVSEQLKEFIFEELMKKYNSAEDSKDYRRFCSFRGEWALESRGQRRDLGGSVKKEFDESLLLWHIATDLCYHWDSMNKPDQQREANNLEDPAINCNKPGSQISDNRREPKSNVNEQDDPKALCKKLSEYLLYILVAHPFMLSSTAGIGQIRYGDTCAEARIFFRRGGVALDKNEACRKLHDAYTDVDPVSVKGDRSKSVLWDACILAKKLSSIGDSKWELMSEVWVEMVSFAASQCRGNFHARQLTAGGELLTIVWFLMTHLGLGEQYRIEAGHARAKLIVEK